MWDVNKNKQKGETEKILRVVFGVCHDLKNEFD